MKSIFRFVGKLMFNKYFLIIMIIMLIIQMAFNGGEALIKYDLIKYSDNEYQLVMFGKYISLDKTLYRFTNFLDRYGLDFQSWQDWFVNAQKYIDNFESVNFDMGRFGAVTDIGSFFSNIGTFFDMVAGAVGLLFYVWSFFALTIGRIAQFVTFTVYGVFMIIFNPYVVTLG